MKILAILLFHLVLISFVTGQTVSKQGSLIYKVSRGENTRVFNLYFNSQESMFVLDNKHIITTSGTLKSVLKKNKVSDNYVLKDYQTMTMQSKEFLKNNQSCRVNDSLPKLNWKLLSETKEIAGFKCQKATTYFRCAEYTAWFASAIPVEIGPWKIGGLPGLILELTNETVQEKYTIFLIEYPARKDIKPMLALGTSNDRNFSSYEDFAKVQREEVKKLVMFIKSQGDTPPDAEVKFDERECY